MDAINLLMPDGTPSKTWICGNCKVEYGFQSYAESCCRSYKCSICGEDCGRQRLKCDPCVSRERMDKAEKITEWDSWVYLENAGHKEGFFETIGDLVEHLENEDAGEWPEYVFACKPISFPAVDIADILENIEGNGYEEITESLSGVEEFEAAINAFNEANASLISYEPDYTQAVKVPARIIECDNQSLPTSEY